MRTLKIGVVLLLLLVLTGGQWGETNSSKWGQIKTAAAGDDFLPSDLSNLVCWLEADVGVTKDGAGAVSLWADQSDQGNDIAQAVGNDQPTWTADQLGSHPAIIFDGATEYLQVTSWAGGNISQPFTFIGIYKGTFAASDQLICGGTSFPTIEYSAAPYIRMWDGAYYTFLTPYSDIWRVIGIVAGVGAGASNCHINDSYISAGNQGSGNNVWSGITIGASHDGTACATLEIVALIVYSDGKSSADILKVHSYLNSKYSAY